MKNYFVYMLECVDGSFYVGVTNNVEKRVWQHQNGWDENAYTHERRPESRQETRAHRKRLARNSTYGETSVGTRPSRRPFGSHLRVTSGAAPRGDELYENSARRSLDYGVSLNPMPIVSTPKR